MPVLKKVILFIELLVGVLLPWKLRCRYSALLYKLGGNSIRDYNSGAIYKKDRNFEKFMHLSSFYMERKMFDEAIDNLNKALGIDSTNEKAIKAYSMLAACYKYKGEKGKFTDTASKLLKLSKAGDK